MAPMISVGNKHKKSNGYESARYYCILVGELKKNGLNIRTELPDIFTRNIQTEVAWIYRRAHTK